MYPSVTDIVPREDFMLDMIGYTQPMGWTPPTLYRHQSARLIGFTNQVN
jgi:hypothetical protein